MGHITIACKTYLIEVPSHYFTLFILIYLIYIHSGTLYVYFLVKKKYHSVASLKMILMKSQGFHLIKYLEFIFILTESPCQKTNINVFHYFDMRWIRFKLESLFQRNLFDVAVSICQHHGLGQNGLSDVYKRWADFLYAKGEHMEAAQKYIQVIFKP